MFIVLFSYRICYYTYGNTEGLKGPNLHTGPKRVINGPWCLNNSFGPKGPC